MGTRERMQVEKDAFDACCIVVDCNMFYLDFMVRFFVVRVNFHGIALKSLLGVDVCLHLHFCSHPCLSAMDVSTT